MKPRPTILRASLFALSLPLMTLGCSSENPTTSVTPPPVVSPDVATVEALLEDVVIPMVKALNLSDLAGGLNGPQGVGCSPFEICSSGTAESCPGSGAVKFNFTGCISHATQVEGSIVLEGTSIEGFATVEVTLDGTPMTGTSAYLAKDGCFLHTYALTASTRDFVVGVISDLQYCSPSGTIGGIEVPTSGLLAFSIPSENRNIQFRFVEGEPPGTFTVNVQNIETLKQTLLCNGVLFGDLTCEVPTPE